MKLYTYINYPGTCKEAFGYYEKHLGGKISMMMTHGDGPQANQFPPDWKDAVLHARIEIGETQLLGADIPAAQPVRSSYLTLLPTRIEEAERIYAALSDGGTVLMPMEETFFALRFAQLRDRFGVSWMILCERS